MAASSYARIGVVPTAALGLLLYLLLALSQAMLLAGPPAATRKAVQMGAAAMSIIGAGFSAWLTYVEIVVLHAICLWCSISAGMIALLVIATVVDLRRRDPRDSSTADGKPISREAGL